MLTMLARRFRRAFLDGAYPLYATNPDGSTSRSSDVNPQGSVLPSPLGGVTDGAGLGAQYNSGGAATGHMWLAWIWGQIGASGPGNRKLYRPDGTFVTVPWGGAKAVVTPALTQVAGGALGARTRFVRVALVKNGGGPGGALALHTYPTPVLATDGEASLAISANNLLTVTGPAAVAGYDGWTPLVGITSQTEVVQGDPPPVIAFGSTWTEPTAGAQTSSATNTPYSWPGWSGSWVFIGLAASTTFYAYPYYDVTTGDTFWVGAPSGNSDQQAVAAATQYGDGHYALTSGGLLGSTPAAAGTGGGTPSTGGGTGSNQKLLT